jgi:dipeptidyl aminopeptidase/acylaminoacyl peptidase
MKKSILPLLLFVITLCAQAQIPMTPERLWQLGRVSALGVTKDGKNVIYSVSTPDAAQNRSARKIFSIPIQGGTATEITSTDGLLGDKNISPDGKYMLSSADVKINKVFGSDFYPELDKSSVQIYDGLNYRHWDTWEDGAFSHVFVHPMVNGKPGEGKDIMPGEPHDCPQKPYGGDEDYVWSPDSKKVVYVTKKKAGTAYAVSTNTDLYEYDVATGATVNLTESNNGYDTNPLFSTTGALAWLRMKRDGYESDKNDLMVRINGVITNLTQDWDESVQSYAWSADGKKLYFIGAIDGTLQLFEVDAPGAVKKPAGVKQLTRGEYDITAIAGQSGNTLVVTRTDMNHAAEVYTVNLTTGMLSQLTHVNDAAYAATAMSKVEKRMVPTTDGKQMLVYVVYPPGFDASKKYPTLLYCQGGPQSALTQFYSFRWNLQLIAANGYIVVAPNRRGMPGHGVAWNEKISKDHGGQVMDDYLSAIDAVAKETFVDQSRLGAIGASYGGYSVFYLAGIHNNRFKTFIAHDGIFNFRSMYGSTEEVFFTEWEYGGPYWDKSNAAAQKSYAQFDPSNFVDKWNTPILIFHGGRDYRVPDTQGFEAFQAAQLRGIKSRLVYLPTENHWVLSAQNALVWQREFFKWLRETL